MEGWHKAQGSPPGRVVETSSPKMDLATLLEEFQFNINVSRWMRKHSNNGLGCLFRDDAFNRTMRDGALLDAPAEIRTSSMTLFANH